MRVNAIYSGLIGRSGYFVLKKSGVEPQAYRDAMARFAGAVHIVSTDGVAGRRGATVIAACSVSDEPATILVCVNRQNAKNEAFLENSRFALNTLAAHHEPLAVGFSGVTGLSSDERFALGRWDTITTGSPTLIDAIATFDCELIDAKDVASHRVLFGKVTGLRMTGNLDPLLYFNRSYRVL